MQTSPEQQINGWKDVQAKIEDSRLLLTHIESETLALRKEQSLLGYSIGEQLKQKAELETFVKQLSAQKLNLEKANATLSEDKVKLQNEIDACNKEAFEQRIVLEKIAKKTTDDRSKLDKDIEQYNIHCEKLRACEKDVHNKRVELETKLDKISKLINELK